MNTKETAIPDLTTAQGVETLILATIDLAKKGELLEGMDFNWANIISKISKNESEKVAIEFGEYLLNNFKRHRLYPRTGSEDERMVYVKRDEICVGRKPTKYTAEDAFAHFKHKDI